MSVLLQTPEKKSGGTHVNVDAFLSKDLEPGPVVGNVSVKLEVVFVPLDRVEGVRAHVEPTGQPGVVAHFHVSGHVDALQGQADRRT